VAFKQAKWVEFYQRWIEQAAAFPPQLSGVDQPPSTAVLPAAFPDPREPSHEATVVLTGYDPNERRVQWIREPHASARAGTAVPV
jgi:hypothetical protein